MKAYHLKQVDAFTSSPFTGNPAGVVLDARGLDEARMQSIAREMNLSETAFILPSTLASADVQIRWFTPAMEVPLCGHATIAAFHAMAEEGMLGMKRNGTFKFKLQTKSGVLPIVVERKHSGSTIEMGIPHPRFSKVRGVRAQMLQALGLQKDDLHPKLPAVKDAYLYIPLSRLRTLQRVRPDHSELADQSRKMKILGVCLFTLQTLEESSAVHSRFFVPAAGISEDPVTGSANGPLGAYLYTYVLGSGLDVPWLSLPDGRMEFIGEQGDELGRKGRVRIRLASRHHEIRHLSIVGEAVTVVDGVLFC